MPLAPCRHSRSRAHLPLLLHPPQGVVSDHAALRRAQQHRSLRGTSGQKHGWPPVGALMAGCRCVCQRVCQMLVAAWEDLLDYFGVFDRAGM